MKIYAASFPKKSLGSFALGVVLTAVSVFLIKYVSDHQINLRAAAAAKGEFLYYFIPVCAAISFWIGRDIFCFLAGKRRVISLKENAFSIDEKSYPYKDIKSFLYDFSDGALKISFANEHVTVRENLYTGFDEILENLYQSTVSRLMEEARDALKTGIVKFGKNIELSETSLKIKRKSVDLDRIKKARVFVGNEGGGKYEELVIEVIDGKKLEINTNTIENIPVLLGMLHEVCRNMKVGL